MRILIVSTVVPPEFSGAGLRSVKQAQCLAENGHRVTVLTATTAPKTFSGINIFSFYSIAQRFVGQGSLRNLVSFLSIPLLIAQFVHLYYCYRPDVVHCIGLSSWFSWASILTGFVLHIPTVSEATLIGSDDLSANQNKKLGFLKTWAFRQSSALVGISPAVADSFASAGAALEKIHVIPNPVDTDEFYPRSPSEKDKLRKGLGLSNFKHVFLSVGVLSKRKGSESMVRAFSLVHERCPDSCLALIGPHPQENVLAGIKRLANDRDLAGQLLLPGKSERVADWMGAADIFLFGSEREGLGTVVVEAFSSGLPVIAIELPGVTDYLIGNDERGFRASSVEQMAEAMVELTRQPELRFAMARAAREDAKRRFEINTVCQQYIGLFKQVVRADQFLT